MAIWYYDLISSVIHIINFQHFPEIVAGIPFQIITFPIPKMTRPAFFRLLYSSIRTTEARKLKRKEVDLVHGVLDICETKGYAQHYVALHGSMTELLKQYDREVGKIYPGKT